MPVVCRGWRSLRSDPLLWREVNVNGAHFSGKGAVSLFVGPRSPIPRDCGCVQHLEIDGGKRLDAKSAAPRESWCWPARS